MRPISALTDGEARRLRGLLFDLDDTVLDHGVLSTEAYLALWRLADAGFLLIGVTGRPAAWGQLLVRQWPIAGMIAENGAVALRNKQQRVQIITRASAEQRSLRRERLQKLGEEVQRRWPALKVTDETFGRLSDYALDIGEAGPVDPKVVEAAKAFAQSAGARVTLSAIQMHLSFEHDDKATGVLRFLNQEFGIDPTLARYNLAFIGDSENDASCFAAFHTTIGVKNLRGNFTLNPRYTTAGARGHGFTEAADVLLARCQPRSAAR